MRKEIGLSFFKVRIMEICGATKNPSELIGSICRKDWISDKPWPKIRRRMSTVLLPSKHLKDPGLLNGLHSLERVPEHRDVTVGVKTLICSMPNCLCLPNAEHLHASEITNTHPFLQDL